MKIKFKTINCNCLLLTFWNEADKVTARKNKCCPSRWQIKLLSMQLAKADTVKTAGKHSCCPCSLQTQTLSNKLANTAVVQAAGKHTFLTSWQTQLLSRKLENKDISIKLETTAAAVQAAGKHKPCFGSWQTQPLSWCIDSWQTQLLSRQLSSNFPYSWCKKAANWTAFKQRPCWGRWKTYPLISAGKHSQCHSSWQTKPLSRQLANTTPD